MKSVILAFLISSTAIAAPVIFSGNDVKTLKPSIDLNGQSKIQSGTVDPTVTATSAPIGSIYLNSSTGVAYRKLDAGSTTNWSNLAIGSVAQSYLLGTVKMTGCASNWVTTSTTFASFPAQTGCVYTATGAASAPSTMIPAITLSSIPAGEILFVYDGIFGVTGAAATVGFRITDGTNVGREVAEVNTGTSTGIISTFTSSIAYSTPQSNVTLQIQGMQASSANASLWGTTSNPGVIKVYYFPTQAQAVLQPALTPAYAGKQWLGATSSSITVGASAAPSATRTTLTNANLATYTLLGSAQNDASQNLQVTSTLPAGEYEVEATAYFEALTAASGTSTACVFDIYDGTNVLGTNTIQQSAQAAVGNQDTHHLRGYFKLSGTTTKTVYLRASKIAGDTAANSNCSVFVGPNAYAMLTIAPRTQILPMPLIANSVVTSSAGVERVERALISQGAICMSSPCPITSQSGNFLSSVTRVSQGAYTLNFTTPFSALPACVISVGGNASQFAITGSSTSSYSFTGYNSPGTATADAGNITVICQGPK